MRRSTLLSTLAVTAAVVGWIAVPASSAGVPGVVDLTIPAARDAEPVVLTGKDFGVDTSWSAPAEPHRAGSRAGPAVLLERAGPRLPGRAQPVRRPDVDTATVTGDKVQGTPVEQAARLRVERARVRADPVPGRRGLHPLPQQQRVRLRHLLGDRPAHDLRLRPRGLPLLEGQRRRQQRPVHRAAGLGRGDRPGEGPRLQRRARVHGVRRRAAPPRPTPRCRRASPASRP